MLKVSLFRAPSVGELIEDDFGNLHLRVCDPCDAPVVELNLCSEGSGHALSLDSIISCLNARIGHPIPDREMVHHLPLLRGQIEVALHFIVEKSADSGGAESKRSHRQI
jgi:hypothetical protein